MEKAVLVPDRKKSRPALGLDSSTQNLTVAVV